MNAADKDVENRRRQLRKWIETHFPNTAAFVRAHNLNQGEVSALLKTKSFGSRKARNLEEQTGMPIRYLEEQSGDPDGGQQGDGNGGNSAVLLPTRPRWPFPGIPEDQVFALPPSQLADLQETMKAAMRVMGLGIDLKPPSPPPALPKRGSVYDPGTAEDAFPMSIPGMPMPWEPGGKTTLEMEREQAQFSAGRVLVNVTAGEPPAANDKFEKVAELSDVRLAAGHGIENDNELANGMIQFRRSFLRSVGADGGRGRVVYAKGDSMEPVIRDGAALLVVPSEGLTMRDLVVGGIYAINYDGKMIVKALAKERLTGQWVARSLNSAKYQDIPLETDVSVRVLGRVVWAGMKL